MKKQVVFIHGGEAYSDYENYLKHLRTVEIDPFKGRSVRWYHQLPELFGDGWEVIKPAMPNSGNAKYQEWKIWFERHFDFIADEVTLIGHSQGAIFLIKYLLENNTPFKIKTLCLAAGVVDVSERFNDALEDGGDFNYDLALLLTLEAKAETILILHSKDDFVVPFEQGEKLAAALPNAEFMVFEDKNHFLIEDFPELIDKIKGL